MKRRRSTAVHAFAVLALLTTICARASMPGVADLDADARSAGNMKTLAVRIGERVFAVSWPAQVTQVSANGVDGHVIAGVRISGVKFHHALSRSEFEEEVGRIVSRVFAVAPRVEEVDVWASVPLVVGRDMIVSGDLAVPTSRPVFTVSVRRGTDPAKALAFWDEDWARIAFKQDW